jgi:phospholipase/lecithinase/hemolysin
MQTMENALCFDERDSVRKPRSKFLKQGFWRAGCPLFIALVVLALPAQAQKQANLERLIVVGDSLSAGFQSGSLLDSQQVHGYANLIAQQGQAKLPLPLISFPGVPNVLELISPGPPPIIASAPGSPGIRENPQVQVLDLAVPGANVHDALFTRPPDPKNPLTDLILGLPGLLALPPISRSQVEWAEALWPTTIVLWIGNNDALGAVLAANPALLTPVSQFQLDYAALIDRLAATGATLVVANIPNVTVIPFLTSAEKVAEEVGLPLSVIGPILGIGPGDFVTPGAFPLIEEILMGQMAGPLPSSVVLSAAQIAQIEGAVNSYNAIIAGEAQSHGAALVDIHGLLDLIHVRGAVENGQRLTTDFLGGIFSLDGVHPTNTGYAIVANEFIKTLNQTFAGGIPPLSVELVAQADPLILASVGRPASALGHLSAGMANSVRSALVH